MCRSYSDEELLLPLLDVSVKKLHDFQPKAVVELVRAGSPQDGPGTAPFASIWARWAAKAVTTPLWVHL